MSESIKFPVVFDYLDVITYLQDYFRTRKQIDKKFSYQSWSTELGFQSRSFLRMIVTGKKKVTPKLIEAFSTTAFAAKEEREYFSLLVQHSQSAQQKSRQEAGTRMLQIIRHRSSIKTLDPNKDFVSNPLLPRLLSLLGYKDIQATASYYAKILKKDLPEIQNALELLKTLGLADSIQNGTETVWHSLTETFHVPDNRGNFDLMKFHEQSLREAISAFQKPKEQRRYKSLLLQLNEEELRDFNQALDDFARAQMLRYNTKSCIGKKMYQSNFNIYSVSETLEAPRALLKG